MSRAIHSHDDIPESKLSLSENIQRKPVLQVSFNSVEQCGKNEGIDGRDYASLLYCHVYE
jgi:hypothetical protein